MYYYVNDILRSIPGAKHRFEAENAILNVRSTFILNLEALLLIKFFARTEHHSSRKYINPRLIYYNHTTIFSQDSHFFPR